LQEIERQTSVPCKLRYFTDSIFESTPVAYGFFTDDWVVHWATPRLYGRLLKMRLDYHIGRISAEQDRLIAEWGEEVATPER